MRWIVMALLLLSACGRGGPFPYTRAERSKNADTGTGTIDVGTRFDAGSGADAGFVDAGQISGWREAWPDACKELFAEPHCLVNGDSFRIMGLESGKDCTGPVRGRESTSLGVFNDHAVFCVDGSEPTQFVISLIDGSVRSARRDCQAISDNGGALVYQTSPISPREEPYLTFATIEDLLDRNPSAVFDDPRLTASRVAGAGADQILAAWHSTDSLLLASLGRRGSERISLEAFDDWIMGLDVAPGGGYVVLGRDVLLQFDENGMQRLALPLPSRNMAGLRCFAPI